MSGPVESCDVSLRVRYAETDAMGFLHHANHFVYFEIGRTELLRRNGLVYADMERQALFYVVVKIECRYRAPARYDDELVLTARTTRLTRVRVDHAYELRRDGRLLAEAGSTLALVDRDGRPTGLPDEMWRTLTGTNG